MTSATGEPRPLTVTVAIPSYLGVPTIERTLRSVQEQTYPHWRCVVVNDGAEDGTGAIIAAMRDPRIRYVADGERRGHPGNLNKAITEALQDNPDIVKMLSADDLLFPYSLADIVRVFSTYPRVGLVAAHFDGIDAEDRTMFRAAMSDRDDIVMKGSDYLLRGVAVGNTIGGPSSVAVRRQAVFSAGLFDTRLPFAPDADYWHRVAAAWDVAWVGRRAGLRYRFHDHSVTGRERLSPRRFRDEIQVVRRVAAAETLFGARWWVHQYTIGRLHAITLQLAIAMMRRRRWDAARLAIVGAMQEGLPLYLPFWLPRLPYQLVRYAVGLNPTRRVLWRRVHEWLQPARIPAEPSASGPRAGADAAAAPAMSRPATDHVDGSVEGEGAHVRN